MQLRNRFYPYPVLAVGNDSYRLGSFTSELKQTKEGHNIRVMIETQLNDDSLLKMITNCDAEIVYHFECPKTCLRYAIGTNDFVFEHLLKSTDVDGQLQICSFVIAKKDIKKYSNDNFAENYEGLTFDLDKGAILAIGDQYNIYITKTKEDLSNEKSIFSIVPNRDINETNMLVNYPSDGTKIVIKLPEKTHKQYNAISQRMDIQPLLHQMIIVPALIYTFAELKHDCFAGDFYQNEEKKWFRALRKACEKIGVRLDEENIENIDSFKVAQQLLDSPIVRGIEYCIFSREGDGLDED